MREGSNIGLQRSEEVVETSKLGADVFWGKVFGLPPTVVWWLSEA